MFDTQEELLSQIRLGQQRSQTRMIRFDEQPVVHAPLEALDPALCERFRSPIMENSERLSGRRPEYRLIDDSELLLTVFAAGGGPVEEND